MTKVVAQRLRRKSTATPRAKTQKAAPRVSAPRADAQPRIAEPLVSRPVIAQRLRRTFTPTPLAKQFERRTPRDVPFASFERSRYPAAALYTAAMAQASLATGEWMAVDLFARLTAALTTATAPIDLVSAAAKIPTDEIRHADLALRMAAALSDDEVPAPNVEPTRHTFLAPPMSMEDLDVAMLELPAIGETLAVALLSTSRDIATDPVARPLFAGLLADEVHHARLGWYYLAWRAPQWTQAERQRVADRAGNFVIQIERMFGRGRDAPRGAKEAARALGVLDTPTQRAAIKKVMEQEIVPGLDGLGLGGSYAWKRRHKLAS